MLKSFVRMLGDNAYGIILALAGLMFLVLLSHDAHGMGMMERAGEYTETRQSATSNTLIADNGIKRCQLEAIDRGHEVTVGVAITGGPIDLGDWVVEHDTLIIRFANEPPMIWDRGTVGNDRVKALADWIWTAQNFEHNLGGQPPFATRDADGRIRLVSQYLDEEGNWACFAHMLDPL